MSQYRDSFMLVEKERGEEWRRVGSDIWMKRGEEKC